MKTKTSIQTVISIALLLASLSKVSAIDNCLTNFVLHLTVTNNVTCSFGTESSDTFQGAFYVGTSIACDPTAPYFVINGPCSPYAVAIGDFSWQCDKARNCPGTEGAPSPCSGGSSQALIFPANTSTWLVNFRTYLCCSVTLCEVGRYGCQPPPQCEYKDIDWNNFLFADN